MKIKIGLKVVWVAVTGAIEEVIKANNLSAEVVTRAEGTFVILLREIESLEKLEEGRSLLKKDFCHFATASVEHEISVLQDEKEGFIPFFEFAIEEIRKYQGVSRGLAHLRSEGGEYPEQARDAAR